MQQSSKQSSSFSRVQMACYAMAASAFVLAAMLLVVMQDRLQPAAQANMVISDGAVTYLVARTRNNEDSLFVLDNSRGVLNIYTLNVSREQLELAQSVDVNRLFN